MKHAKPHDAHERRRKRRRPPADARPDAVPRRQVLAPALALVAITLAVFLPVVGHEFLDWDDRQSIQHNPSFNPPTLESLGRYWTRYEPNVQFYVPVTYTVLWALANQPGGDGADEQGMSPTPFHVFNLLVHSTNAALAFLVLRRLVPSATGAFFGAALFALHPLQVEPVAWATSMYSGLSASFALLALLQFMRYTDRVAEGARAREAWTAYGVATACFVLALLTKPTVVLLPVAIAAIEAGLRGRPWRGLVWPLGAWLLVSVPIALVAKAAQPVSTPYWPLWRRPFLAADSLAFYVYKLLIPLRLIPDYGRSPAWVEQTGAWRWTWIAPALLAAVALFLLVRRRRPTLFVCLAVFVVTLLPVLGLTPFDYQRYSSVADRYVYLSMLGPAMLLAAVISHKPTRGVVRGAAAGLVVLAVLAHVQTYRWHDTKSLFDHTLRVNPHSLAANSVYGYLAAAAGRNDEAHDRYRRALDANPEDRNVLYLMGNLYLRTGRFDDAVDAYQRALKTWPDYAAVYSNLGVALFQSGRAQEAVQALERAVSLNPRSSDAQLNMALVQMGLENWPRARRHYEETLRLNPQSAAARRGLAALESMGR